MKEIMIKPIGYVRNEVHEKKDISWGKDISFIELEEAYHTGLKGLEKFSHAIVLFYLDQNI